MNRWWTFILNFDTMPFYVLVHTYLSRRIKVVLKLSFPKQSLSVQWKNERVCHANCVNILIIITINDITVKSIATCLNIFSHRFFEKISCFNHITTSFLKNVYVWKSLKIVQLLIIFLYLFSGKPIELMMFFQWHRTFPQGSN